MEFAYQVTADERAVVRDALWFAASQYNKQAEKAEREQLYDTQKMYLQKVTAIRAIYDQM